jgi:NAD(P)-dependent dehydrogenase (short-subunit alcohol dehydrogenase family)
VLDVDTIAACYQFIKDKCGKLDILVNNAGIADRRDGKPSVVPIDAVEKTMSTNFIGPVRVTQALLPLLKQSKQASIVNVSSGLGSLTMTSDLDGPYSKVDYFAYSCSKSALNMFTVKLAHELRNTSIRVNSAAPGHTATDLNDHSGPQTVEEGAEETVRLALIGVEAPTGQFTDRKSVMPW